MTTGATDIQVLNTVELNPTIAMVFTPCFVVCQLESVVAKVAG